MKVQIIPFTEYCEKSGSNYHTARRKFTVSEYFVNGEIVKAVNVSDLQAIPEGANVLQGLPISLLESLPELQTVANEHETKANYLQTQYNLLQKKYESLQNTCTQLERTGKQSANELQTALNDNKQLANKLHECETKMQGISTQRTANQLTFILLLLGSCSVAFGITAPLLTSAGMPFIWAYCLALFIDFAAMAFILQRYERFGIITGLCAALQLLVLLTAELFNANFIIFAKSLLISVPLFVALYGFSKKLNGN